jgi:hypothetical protein
MADSEQSKIRYDDFIATVLPDPAKPEATIMLAGFIGHGADGQVRLYPDPSLGTWYDLPEGDVVHSIPIPDAKLGGSYVWVRASAKITPGAAAAPSAPAADLAAAAPAAVHPTPTAQPTPATHCFICPPLTQDCTVATVCTQNCTTPLGGCLPHQTAATVCTQNCTTPLGGCLPVQPTPTVQTHCFVCPPITQQCSAAILCSQFNQCGHHPTAATICTETCNTFLVGCLQTRLANCIPITQPQICNIAVSPNCPPPPPGTPVQQGQQQFAAAAAIQPTPSAVNQCGVHTAATVCTQPVACQPSVVHICPTPSAVHQCGPHTAATVCTQPPACHPSVNMICPTPSAVHQCGANTAATVCTQPPVCPHQTAATICTQPAVCHPSVHICPTPSAVHQCGVFTPFCPQ